ncbi:sigma-70 family RNA polymerase sigma factor [bacterium]|nr:sigma-70 family RNA polymerase sigma factor [bacterium]
MESQRAAELECLRELVAGWDVWPRFWQLFGAVIQGEVRKFDHYDPQLLDNVFHDLVLRLIDGDFKHIRRHLNKPHPSGFGALVRTMTRNMLIDNWRRIKRRGELELLDSDRPAGDTVSGVPAQPAPADDTEERLRELLLNATGGDPDSIAFRILSLRFIEGESVSYIADKLAMQPNAVSHQIRYYLRKLKTHHRAELMELI